MPLFMLAWTERRPCGPPALLLALSRAHSLVITDIVVGIGVGAPGRSVNIIFSARSSLPPSPTDVPAAARPWLGGS